MVKVKYSDYYPAEYKPLNYATDGAAGLDLRYLGRSAVLKPGFSLYVNTGISVAIPPGAMGLVLPRSGLGRKGLRIRNTAGVIDSDYRGEIIVDMVYDPYEDETLRVEYGDRVAQMLLLPCLKLMPVEVNELPPTERGAGGFNSTGTA